MKKGFTLVEIIVALMIFSIVAVVALAALVKIVDANRKAQTTQDAVIGLSFALDAMSRELRTATDIRCVPTSTGSFTSVDSLSPSLCTSTGHNQLIAFRSATLNDAKTCNLVYAYLFVKDNNNGTYQLKKARQSKGSAHCADSFNSDLYFPVIPDGVTLSDYKLGLSTSVYPTVFVDLSGYSGIREQSKTYFNVQTSVSQRTL